VIRVDPLLFAVSLRRCNWLWLAASLYGDAPVTNTRQVKEGLTCQGSTGQDSTGLMAQQRNGTQTTCSPPFSPKLVTDPWMRSYCGPSQSFHPIIFTGQQLTRLVAASVLNPTKVFSAQPLLRPSITKSFIYKQSRAFHATTNNMAIKT
jgi:hypothetical protein